MTPSPAVVVSCNTPGLAVLRSLARAGIPTVAASYAGGDAGTASRDAHRCLSLPHPDHREPEFVEALTEALRQLPRPIVFAASDAALGSFARHLEQLEEVAIVACPSASAIEAMLDKRLTAELAERCGVPFPRWSSSASASEIQGFCDEVGFPLLVKPSVSHSFVDRFHFKMTRVSGPAELQAALDRFQDANVILQEIIPGTDHDVFNYNTYAVDGVAAVEFTARQLRKAPPVTGSPCVAVSSRVPEIVELGRALVKELGLTGFICIEFARDSRDERFVVLDLNGRHNLSGTLAPRSGIDFPLIEYRHRVEGRLPKPQSFEEGVYWIDTLRDLGYGLHADRERSGGLRALARPYLSKHAFALWSLRDPAPFAKRAAHLVRHRRH